MDSDDSGEISFEEFIDGCMHLQGAAQSLQASRMILFEPMNFSRENWENISVNPSQRANHEVEDFRREFRFLCKDIAKIGRGANWA